MSRLRAVPRRVVVTHLCVFGGFLALGVVLWWRVWVTGDPTSTISCRCGDPSQEVWFLAWTPWALLHGHNPFLSQAIFAGRGGANMMANTSWMAPSVVLAPVTWLFGPIASFNVGAVVGPAVSGWSFFLAARKVSSSLAGPVLGALLYGFSPFVVSNDPFGHLNFTLLFFPPLAFLLLQDLVVGRVHRPVRVGLALGGLVVVQFFTSTELLAMVGVVGVVAGLAGLALAPGPIWARRRELGVALGVAGVVVAVVLAYPVWFLLEGPRHVVGFPWPDSPALGGPASSIVRAGRDVHLPSPFLELGGYYGGAGPNFGSARFPSIFFLGFPLLGFLALSSVAWYRVRLAWVCLVAGAAAWVFSFGTMLGTELEPATRQVHPWWLPWRALSHLPLVGDIQPIRFVGVAMFAVSLLLVVGVDRLPPGLVALWERIGAGRGGGGGGRSAGRVAAGLVAVVAGAVLVPVALTVSVPYTVRPGSLPAWFRDQAPRLPPETVVLVTPFGDQEAMGWQAESGFAFRLAGGFAVVPGLSGRSEFVVPPTGAEAVLARLSPGPETIPTGPPPGSDADVAAVSGALARWGVGVVVVTRAGSSPTYAAGFFTAVFGRAPTVEGDTWVWSGPAGTPVAVTPDLLVRCQRAGQGDRSPLAVPDCVLAGSSS